MPQTVPVPARNAGDYEIRYKHLGKHMRATLLRRASTGALVELGAEDISYPIVQRMLARTEGTPPPEELGFISDVDELGAFGSRLKKLAKNVAKSKFGKMVKGFGSVAMSFVPGGGAAKAAFQGTRALVQAQRRSTLSGWGDEVGAARKPAPAKKVATKAPARKPAPVKKAATKAPARKPAPVKKAATKAPARKPAPVKKATKAKAAKLSNSIAPSAPKLAAAIAEVPDVPPAQRDLLDDRAVEAARVLASAPEEDRPALAEKIESRLDAYKVITPEGDTVWIPKAVVGG